MRLDAVEIAAACRRAALDARRRRCPQPPASPVLHRRRGQDGARGRRQRRANASSTGDARSRSSRISGCARRAFGRHALARRFEQPRPIGHLGVAQLLLRFVEQVRQIDVGRRGRASRTSAAPSRPTGHRRTCAPAPAESQGARHRREHGQPIVPRRLEGRTRRHCFERQRARRRDASPRKPWRGDPRRELRQAETRQPDGRRPRPRYRAREVVGGAARGGDDRQGL